MKITYTLLASLILILAVSVSAESTQESHASTTSRIDRRIENLTERISNLEDRRSSTTRATSTRARVAQAADPVCAKAAIDIRDNAITTAFKTQNDGLIAAIATRTAAYKAAFDLTGKDRVKAIKAGQDTFKKTRVALQNALKAADKSARATFRTSMKACGATESEVSASDVTVSLTQ